MELDFILTELKQAWYFQILLIYCIHFYMKSTSNNHINSRLRQSRTWNKCVTARWFLNKPNIKVSCQSRAYRLGWNELSAQATGVGAAVRHLSRAVRRAAGGGRRSGRAALGEARERLRLSGGRSAGPGTWAAGRRRPPPRCTCTREPHTAPSCLLYARRTQFVPSCTLSARFVNTLIKNASNKSAMNMTYRTQLYLSAI